MAFNSMENPEMTNNGQEENQRKNGTVAADCKYPFGWTLLCINFAWRRVLFMASNFQDARFVTKQHDLRNLARNINCWIAKSFTYDWVCDQWCDGYHAPHEHHHMYQCWNFTPIIVTHRWSCSFTLPVIISAMSTSGEGHGTQCCRN